GAVAFLVDLGAAQRVECFLAQRLRLIQPSLLGERADEGSLNMQREAMIWAESAPAPREDLRQQLPGPGGISLQQAQHPQLLDVKKPVALVSNPYPLTTSQGLPDIMLRFRICATDFQDLAQLCNRVNCPNIIGPQDPFKDLENLALERLSLPGVAAISQGHR